MLAVGAGGLGCDQAAARFKGDLSPSTYPYSLSFIQPDQHAAKKSPRPPMAAPLMGAEVMIDGKRLA
ncbi:MAG: hypothetical protein ACRBN8_14580 [Nannocystales bacterium]